MGIFNQFNETQATELWDEIVKKSIIKFRTTMKNMPTYMVYQNANKIRIYETLYNMFSNLDFSLQDYENIVKNLEEDEDILDKVYHFLEVNYPEVIKEFSYQLQDFLSDALSTYNYALPRSSDIIHYNN